MSALLAAFEAADDSRTWRSPWLPSVRQDCPVASRSATVAGLSPVMTSDLSVRSTATGQGKDDATSANEVEGSQSLSPTSRRWLRSPLKIVRHARANSLAR